MDTEYTKNLQNLYNNTKNINSYKNWSSLVQAKFEELEHDVKIDTHSWKFQEEDHGVKIYTKECKGKPTKYKGVGIIEHSAEKVIEGLNSEDMNFRREWDKNCVDSYLLDVFDNRRFKVIYSIYQAPNALRKFISFRDYIHISDYKMKGEDHLLVSFSIPEQFPSCKGNVRANMLLAGWYCEKLDNMTTKVTYVFHSDFSGWIPSGMTSVCNKSIPKSVAYMREALNKRNIH